MFPCWKVRNLASLSCFALFEKYFSRNLVLKLAQVTSYAQVCISCCISTHQYLASATRKNVTNESFYAYVQSITRHIFSHSLSQASASSGMDLPANLVGLCLMKSFIVTGRVGGIMAQGCATTGCMASTIRWITLAISSAPALFLCLLLAIA